MGKNDHTFDLYCNSLNHSTIPDYLQYRFAGRKCHYARNQFLVPWLIKIPYYIYLGDKREKCQKPLIAIDEHPIEFHLEHGLLTPNSPWQKPKGQDDANDLAELDLGESALEDTVSSLTILSNSAQCRSQSKVCGTDGSACAV
jgi:hypothetical protein